MEGQRKVAEADLGLQVAHPNSLFIIDGYRVTHNSDGIVGDRGGGLVVMPDVFMLAHRAPIISAATRNNVAAIYSQSEYAKDGGLLSYGVDQVDTYRRTPPMSIAFYAALRRPISPSSFRPSSRWS
jgi:hypothetical protein